MPQRRKKLALVVVASVVLLGAAALWAGPSRSPVTDASVKTTEAQFQSFCDVVQTQVGESCSARAHSHQANTGAMSQDLAVSRPAEGAAQLPVRLLDGWGNAVQISIGGDGVTLRSLGQDGELGSADDLMRFCPRKAPS